MVAARSTALPTASSAAARRWVAAALRRRRRGALWTITLLVAGTVAGLAGPALLGAVVDVVARHGRRATIDHLALALAAAAVAEAALAALARVAMARLGEDLLAELRRETLGTALDLDVETVEQAGTGDLVGRCTTDIAVLSDVTRDVLPWVASAAILTALTLVALCLQSPLLAVTALAGTPVSLAATRRYVRRAPPVYRREREAMADLVGGLVETSEGSRTLRAYGASEDQRARVGQAVTAWLLARAAGVRIRTRFFPGLAIGQGISLAATVAAGAYLSGRGSLSTGQVTAGALYVARLYDPLSLLLEVLDKLQSAQASLSRLVGVLTVTGPPSPPPLGAVATRPVGVSAQALSFAYAGGDEVVSGVDLEVAPGQRAVVVGASGAGKSTLAGLLAGLLTPATGRVRLGAHHLADLAADDRRRLVALVTQEPHVFAGTVGWNVTLGARHRPGVDAAACLEAVGATWVASLPDGLKTVVGPGGHRLTPAQAQQLALARLVAADPAVVILDEATADLSGGAAGAAESALSAALADRTVIAIAHRLDTARTADAVVVMHDGRIVETGSHVDLVGREGVYAALWAAWARSR
ncbi:MAG TPA: ABC transporter ATP-binding protein [Acidimicrobiia bacterium]|nr:ABC transporter ATP-binding protein [Acidimicrobiia bacterium]